MDLTQVTIPEYDQRTGKGNYNPGRGGVAVDTFVIHWMDGTMGDADRVFSNPSTVHSAHFGVEDGSIHQYVRLADTAFHAGIYSMNQRSVGIEHSAQPGRDASDATYETSAHLVATVCRQLGKRVEEFAFLRHGQVAPTTCCGTVDVERIRNRALEIEGDSSATEATLASSVKVPVRMEGRVTSNSGVNVRTSPNLSGTVLRQMSLSQGFWYVGTVQGDDVEGNPVWLLLEDGHYCWSGATDYKQPTSNA